MKKLKFGLSSLEESYLILKRTVQCPHIYTEIDKEIVRDADTWVSVKYGRSVDYIPLLQRLGVKVIER